MAFYDKEFQALVNQKTPIVDLMREEGEHITGSGNTLSFMCPMCGGDFENGKIKVSENFFRCFRCDKLGLPHFRGLPINYLQLRRGMTLQEAVEYLAKRANIPLKQAQARAAAPADPVKVKLYMEMMKFYEQFKEPAIAYLRSRGVKEEEAPRLVAKYRIGFAHGGMSLATHLFKKEFSSPVLRKYNLIRDTGADRFFNRLIVPITRRGMPYDFYSRRVDNSSHLKHLPLEGVGMDFGIDFIPKFAPVVDLYESILNKLVAEADGYQHGIATGGISNLKIPELIASLKRIAPRVVRLILDSDKEGQGQRAALELGQKLTEAGFTVVVVLLPIGEDVSALYASGKGQVFRDCVDQALPFTTYRAHFLMREVPLELIEQHLNWRKNECSPETWTTSAIFFSSSSA